MLTREQWYQWVRDLGLSYPNFDEYLDRTGKREAVLSFWLKDCCLRGVSIDALDSARQRLLTGEVIGLGEFKPWALLQYIRCLCTPSKLYTDWVSAGRPGDCPTLIDDAAERLKAVMEVQRILKEKESSLRDWLKGNASFKRRIVPVEASHTEGDGIPVCSPEETDRWLSPHRAAAERVRSES